MSKKKDGPLADDECARRTAQINASYLELEKQDLKRQVSTREGRRIIARFIFDNCGLFMPGWAPSAEIHKLAGLRTIASELLFKLEDFAPGDVRRMVDEWFADRYDRRVKLDPDMEE